MILQSLVAYYEELLAQGKISAPGWDDTFKVSFQLELDDTGALIDVIDVRELMPVGKKLCSMRGAAPSASGRCRRPGSKGDSGIF